MASSCSLLQSGGKFSTKRILFGAASRRGGKDIVLIPGTIAAASNTKHSLKEIPDDNKNRTIVAHWYRRWCICGHRRSRILGLSICFLPLYPYYYYFRNIVPERIQWIPLPSSFLFLPLRLYLFGFSGLGTKVPSLFAITSDFCLAKVTRMGLS